MKKPLEFEDLTEEQINYLWNGVGSAHFFIDPHDLIFKDPSKRHDFLYWRGGEDKERREADDLFYKECKSKCYEHGGLSRPLYLIAAFVYYQGLRLLGKYAFEYEPIAEDWETIKARIDKFREGKK